MTTLRRHMPQEEPPSPGRPPCHPVVSPASQEDSHGELKVVRFETTQPIPQPGYGQIELNGTCWDVWTWTSEEWYATPTDNRPVGCEVVAAGKVMIWTVPTGSVYTKPWE